jgi:hypothetical protein
VVEIGQGRGVVRCGTREELGLFVKGVALVMVLRCRMTPGEQDPSSEMGIELCQVAISGGTPCLQVACLVPSLRMTHVPL